MRGGIHRARKLRRRRRMPMRSNVFRVPLRLPGNAPAVWREDWNQHPFMRSIRVEVSYQLLRLARIIQGSSCRSKPSPEGCASQSPDSRIQATVASRRTRLQGRSSGDSRPMRVSRCLGLVHEVICIILVAFHAGCASAITDLLNRGLFAGKTRSMTGYYRTKCHVSD